MTPTHHVTITEPLYLRLKKLAEKKGQSVEAFVQETLEETVEETNPADFSLLVPLPDPDHVLPPYGSPEEATLRRELAKVLSKGPSLSQMIIDDRGER